jgi:DNA mismatch repair ATPase MutS
MTREDEDYADVLDDRTWSDLDMDLIYDRLDRTLTSPGEQILYSLLRRPLFETRGLEERNRWISLISQDRALRETLQDTLGRLGRMDGQAVTELLWSDLPKAVVPRVWIYLPLALLPVFAALAVAQQAWAWFGLAAVFLSNMIVHFLSKRRAGDHFSSVRYLGRLISYAKKLALLHIPEMSEQQRSLAQDAKAVSRIARKTVYLAPGGSDPLYDYPNILVLTEVRAFNDVLRIIEKKRQILKNIFERIGFMDAMVAIASYRSTAGTHCRPAFVDSQPRLDFEAAVHPLLPNPVSNSFSLDESGVLVTGSNMSGKTCFLKMIGVNAILAQTIVTCLAIKYETSFFQVKSLIGRKDNLIEGKSYYLDEIQALRRLFEPGRNSAGRLYLVDELFRGTNSAERIAASVEVLRYLTRTLNACIFATTHDMEIPELIGPGFINYHFQEEIGESGIAFNYKLLTGPSTTRNAIRLLQQAGYPTEIIEAAERRIQSLSG